MPNRPDPAQFARYSYILSLVSTGILTLAVLIAFIPVDAIKPLFHIVWLTIVTGAVGAFMGYAARADFKAHPPEHPELEHQARSGFRTNVFALAVTLLLAVFRIAIGLIFFG